MNAVNNKHLNEMTDNVTLKTLREATSRYEVAKESYRLHDDSPDGILSAGEHLYRLVCNLIRQGRIYTYRDAVVDMMDDDKNPDPDDFD